VKAIRATGGTCDQVSEIELAQAKAEIGAEGIGCEPASAVTLAGLKKLVKQGIVQPQETVVLVLTGNLLKDPDFTMEFHKGELLPATVPATAPVQDSLAPLRHPPIVLDATLDAVTRALEQAEKN
jgi:threonine synthase